ncbi:DUF1269 domain-containing protein [Brevibacterium sp. 5221]|uniref:DUF1269 domain-containing protein n=2 Tax=Brevibacterium TaxID=1696 RepID=A0A6N9H9N3_9MICO|nr:DUF1269 domain-containing protein [Brevibacterium rongguiense]MYM20800.1 DUF1269 domain-containing protein [Brevibacterium rongguiense]
MADYAAIITFPDDAKTFEAFSKLKNSPSYIDAGAIVERSEDGHWRVVDATDASIGGGLAGGSVIGALVGLLGGPLGMLLGWATGAAVGGAVDASRAADTSDVLSDFAAQVRPGSNGLIVQGSEEGIPAVDAIVGELGGALIRRPLDQVLDELDAEREAAEAAAAAAQAKLREQHRSERREKWQERWDEMRDRLIGKDKDKKA